MEAVGLGLIKQRAGREGDRWPTRGGTPIGGRAVADGSRGTDRIPLVYLDFEGREIEGRWWSVREGDRRGETRRERRRRRVAGSREGGR